MTDAAVEIRAREWRKLNPDVWRECIEAPALYEATHDRRVSVKLLMEQVRAKDRVNWHGQEVKLNNSFAPIFARDAHRRPSRACGLHRNAEISV